MEELKAFTIDFIPESGLAAELSSILNSDADFQIRLHSKSCILFENKLSEEMVRAVLPFCPCLLFLILSQNNFERAHPLIQALSARKSDIQIIVIFEGSNIKLVYELLKLGVIDFITPPLKAVDILPRVWRALKKISPDASLVVTIKAETGMKQLVGKNKVFLSEVRKIPLIAQCDATVLISGETGSGKEIVARAIHYIGHRAGRPFVPVSCGAIPDELIENELFGHAKGAYTGATLSQSGLIAAADGGTLFLDDIDSLPLSAQVKLLRFLQEKEYRPLGSNRLHRANVRIIASTSRDLVDMVSNGRFRGDLLYRLDIIPIQMPPLRERMDDLELLAHHFLEKYATELRKPFKELASEAIRKLLAYDWPGNVRELENVIERAVVFSTRKDIQVEDIFISQTRGSDQPESLSAAKTKFVAQFERTYIQNLLLQHQGNITQAARSAKKNRRAFWELLRKYKIDAQKFKTTA